MTRVKELTHAVLECVGTQESMMQAIRSTRKGGYVSYVGVPHGVELDGQELFYAHVHLHGGPAPVRRFSAAADRPGVEREDQTGKGLRPYAASRTSGGGLPRNGRTPRDQSAAASVTHFRMVNYELRIRKFNGDIAIPVESFAQAIGFAISQPKDVDVNENPVPDHSACAVS